MLSVKLGAQHFNHL